MTRFVLLTQPHSTLGRIRARILETVITDRPWGEMPQVRNPQLFRALAPAWSGD